MKAAVPGMPVPLSVLLSKSITRLHTSDEVVDVIEEDKKKLKIKENAGAITKSPNRKKSIA